MIDHQKDYIYDLAEILGSLRIWFFKNNIRPQPDGYYHFNLPIQAADILDGLQVVHGFRIHYD